MESMNVTNARQDFYNLISNVNSSHRPIRINSKNGDAVLLSADDWNAIEETLFLTSIPGFVDKIKSSEAETLDSMVVADELDW